MRKQLFYLNNRDLTAYTWDKGSLSIAQTFQNDAAGWEAFSGFLENNQKIAACLLVDLIEESFQRDTIPHVTGNARKTLIKRRIGQLYRDSPFRQGTIVGREKEGRKDDQILFSALTNPDLVKPWVDALVKQAVPLAGVFSLALLSTVLFKKLRLETGALILVTHQSSGLRLSYLHDGALVFSRLTYLPHLNAEAIADTVTQELAKTRQFLASTRQLPIGALVNIAIVANDDNLAALKTVCVDTASVFHRLISFEEAAQPLGLKQKSAIATCDPLFLSILGASVPPNHYPLLEQARFYTIWQSRKAIYALSAATIAGGVLWTGVTGLDIVHTQQKNKQIVHEIQAAEDQYQTSINSMPSTVARPQIMKDTVSIERMISQNAPEPVALFSLVSYALNDLPEIRINQMQWHVSETAPVSGVAEPAPVARVIIETAPPPGLIGIPAKPYQILIVEGAIEPFKNDYRTALESVARFTAALRTNKQLKVEVTQAPLDIRPTVKLDGKEGDDDGKARAHFILKLIWSP